MQIYQLHVSRTNKIQISICTLKQITFKQHITLPMQHVEMYYHPTYQIRFHFGTKCFEKTTET